MITFDGLYSLISLFLSLFAIKVTTFIGKTDLKKYPFGKSSIEPLIVIFKSIVLLVMCAITLSNAVKEVVAGGNSVDAGFAMIYAIVSSVGCTLVYSYMKKSSKKLNSEIVKAESNQWLMDAILSIGVLVGFIISMLLNSFGLGEISRYVDPAMVIITSVIFLKVPIKSLLDAFKEVIHVKADDEINEDIYALVKEIEEEYNFDESIARVAKMGRELRIEIDFIVSKDSKIETLDDMDKLREIIDKETNHFELQKWLNVSFTKNKKWAI